MSNIFYHKQVFFSNGKDYSDESLDPVIRANIAANGDKFTKVYEICSKYLDQDKSNYQSFVLEMRALLNVPFELSLSPFDFLFDVRPSNGNPNIPLGYYDDLSPDKGALINRFGNVVNSSKPSKKRYCAVTACGRFVSRELHSPEGNMVYAFDGHVVERYSDPNRCILCTFIGSNASKDSYIYVEKNTVGFSNQIPFSTSFVDSLSENSHRQTYVNKNVKRKNDEKLKEILSSFLIGSLYKNPVELDGESVFMYFFETPELKHEFFEKHRELTPPLIHKSLTKEISFSFNPLTSKLSLTRTVSEGATPVIINRESLGLSTEQMLFYHNILTYLETTGVVVEKVNVGANEHKDTPNSRGDIMSFNANILKVRKSFCLTESEESAEKEFKLVAPIYLGVELEFAFLSSSVNRKDLISSIHSTDFGRHSIVKSDSSIEPDGIEIVTVPASLDYHKNCFRNSFLSNDFWKNLTVNKSCGLHVHISKESFSTFNRETGGYGSNRLPMGRFVSFMNRQSNLPFVCKIGGRQPNEYCQVVPRNPLSAAFVADNSAFLKSLYRNYNSSRRHVVNLTNDKTLEVRLFKATKSMNTLFMRLEFCDALVNFSKYTSSDKLDYKDFIAYVMSQSWIRKKYPNLVRWLFVQGYLKCEKRVNPKTNKKYRKYYLSKESST